MNNKQLMDVILADFRDNKPLDKERALELVRERLKDYPKQMSDFGEWFEKNSDSLLKRINA